MRLLGALARAAEPLARMSRCVAHADSSAHAPVCAQHLVTSRPRVSTIMIVVADVPAWCSILISQDTIAT